MQLLHSLLALLLQSRIDLFFVGIDAKQSEGRSDGRNRTFAAAIAYLRDIGRIELIGLALIILHPTWCMRVITLEHFSIPNHTI